MVAWMTAQAGVIGSALIEPSFIPQILAETDPSDFCAQYLAAYKAMAAMQAEGAPIDPVTLVHRLGDTYRDWVMDLMRLTPTAMNVEAYISATRERSRLFRLRELSETLGSAASMDEARVLVEQAAALCSDRSGLRIFTAAESMVDFYDRHQKAPQAYLDWGFSKLNDHVHASLGKFIILGGRPSSGKSALMLQLAAHMAKKHRVGMFSFETDAGTLTDRTVSSQAQVSYRSILQNDLRLESWQKITGAAQHLSELPLSLIEASGMTVNDIQAVALAQRFEIIFVDYVQLVTPGSFRANRTEQVSEISRALHTLAQRHKITVVALSQFSRPEKMKNGAVRPPTMEDLRESGQLEQDADVVMLLYRYVPDDSKSQRCLYIAKNKEGTIGRFPMDFDGDHQTFTQAKTTYQDIQEAAAKASRFKELKDAEPDNPFVQGELPL